MTECLVNQEFVAVTQIDHGSQVTVISRQLYERLKIIGGIRYLPKERIGLKGIAGKTEEIKVPPLILTLQFGYVEIEQRAVVSESMTGPVSYTHLTLPTKA